MEFQIISGNAGTGMCQRGAYEHGCEFAPVAGTYSIFIEILSALYCIYVVSAVDEPRRYFCIHRKNRVSAYRFGEHRNKVRNS